MPGQHALDLLPSCIDPEACREAAEALEAEAHKYAAAATNPVLTDAMRAWSRDYSRRLRHVATFLRAYRPSA